MKPAISQGIRRFFLASACLFLGLSGCGSPKILVEEYRPIIRANPTPADSLFNRGLALNLLGRNEEAAEAFTASVTLNPNDGDAWFKLGKIYRDLGRNKEARNAYTRAFEIGSFEAQHLDRGNAYMFLSRYSECEKEYELALKADEPHPISSMCYLAQSCLLQDKNDLAVKHYTKALATDAVSARQYNAYPNLGAAYQKLGNTEKALECYDKGLEYNPKDVNIYWNKAIIYSNQGNVAKVLEQAAALDSLNPEKAAIIYKQFGKPAAQ